MAEKCTNTSSPPSCSMKPYPLASLNHFTFPLITIRLLQSLLLGALTVDACPAVVSGRVEMTRAPENCQAGFLRLIQRPIQLAIAQQAAHIPPGFRIGNQLDEAIGIHRAGVLEPATHRLRSGIVCRDRRVHPPKSLEQLREMRGTEVQVEIGHRNPVRIESDVQSARHQGRGARQQLNEPPRARGRQCLDIEYALLTYQRRQEQCVDAEFLRLRFDRRAVGPRENRAQHSGLARRAERSLPAKPDGCRAVAAHAESLAPPEEHFEIGGRVRQHDSDFALRFAVEPGEEQRVDPRETGFDSRRGRRERSDRRSKCEWRETGLAAGAHAVVAPPGPLRGGGADAAPPPPGTAPPRPLAEPATPRGAPPALPRR